MGPAFGFLARSPRCDVLVVCTGNVCRSPYVAATLRARVPGIVVRSAGTAAMVGEPPTEAVVAMLDEHGIEPGNDRGRRLTRRAVAGARLVLTAERSHRSAVVTLDPRADRRAFTIKELARLLSGDRVPNDGMDALLERAALARVADAAVERDDDLRDPYGLDAAAYLTMAADADAALAVVIPALTRAVGR